MQSLLRHVAYLCALVWCLSFAACSKNGSAKNGPLKTRLSEHYISNIPENEQEHVIQAEQDVAMAQRELVRVEASHEESAMLLKLAEYELKEAQILASAAQARMDLAQKRARLPEIVRARRELYLASVRRDVAGAKVQERKANRDYLAAQVKYRRARAHAMEARYELEKARLAHRHEIKPEGFTLTEYERQYHQRMARAKQARLRADGSRKAAMNARDRWLALEHKVQAVEGERPGPEAAPPIEKTSAPQAGGR